MARKTPCLLACVSRFLCVCVYLVDVLLATIVAGARLALRVLVGEAGAKALVHCAGGKVFRGDELKARALAVLLVLDEVKELWVMLGQRGLAGEGLWNVSHGAGSGCGSK